MSIFIQSLMCRQDSFGIINSKRIFYDKAADCFISFKNIRNNKCVTMIRYRRPFLSL